MLDYDKTHEDAARRKAELARREQEIAVERKRLDEEAEKIRRERLGLDQIIEGLEFLSSTHELEPPPIPGLTEHISRILQQTTVPLMPTQIRDSCMAVGITGSSMKTLLISVHNVLRKLKPNLQESENDGRKAYKWKSPLPLRRIRLTGPPLDVDKIPDAVRTAILNSDEPK